MTCFCKRYLRLFHSCKSSLPKVFFKKAVCPWPNQTVTLQQEIWWFRGATRSSLPNVLFKNAVLTNHTANLLHENINAKELFQESCYETWFEYLLYTDVLLQICCIIDVCLKSKEPLVFAFSYFFSWASVYR